MSLEKSGAPIEQNKEISKEIFDLKGPLKNILKEISNNIEKGKYGLIIGDDASGRIPTLIMDRVIKEIYRERGFNSPQTLTLFFAGSRGLVFRESPATKEVLKKKKGGIAEILDAYFLKKKKALADSREGAVGNKVLVVTDIIDTGASLSPLAEVLKQKELEFDIITISGGSARLYLEMDRGRIVSGEVAATIYGRRDLSGVIKKPEDVFATPAKKFTNEKGEKIVKDPVKFQKGMNKVREDALVVADELLEWYRQERNNK